MFDPVNQVVNDNVPSPSAATPPTRPNFKLTFLSGGGQGSYNGCVNRATAFCTVYPRPGNPGITHASLGALDEYCSAVTSIAAITSTANPAGAIATFQWYDHALNLQGSLPQGDAIAHTPIVSLSPSPTHTLRVAGPVPPTKKIKINNCGRTSFHGGFPHETLSSQQRYHLRKVFVARNRDKYPVHIC